MLCEGINCGSGTCIGGLCICDPNYVNVGNFCEESTSLPVCEANPCCRSGPNPELCCQNGVCSDENYVFSGDAITNNSDECKCLCTDNFGGLFN